MIKKVIVFLLALFAFIPVLYAQSGKNAVIDLILSSYSAKTFTTKQVTDNEIDVIIKCGIKAPSARNSQLWKFTTVKNVNLSKKIISNFNDGNVLIVISGLDSKQEGVNIDFDCALATQNMYIAAESLGLGAHIYTGPVNNINSSMKKDLSIPDGYRVVSVLRIGNIDKSVDSVASASTRKDAKELVNTSK